MIRTIISLIAPVTVTVGLALAAPRHDPPIAVHFSPHGGCTAAIVELIDHADKSVRAQAYSFTSRPIADALIAAHRRGVAVEIVLDGGQRDDLHSLGGQCAGAGIPVSYDRRHAIAHNKVIIIDGRIVIGGSFNYSRAAEESNAENMVVLRDTRTAAAFGRNWTLHRGHSEP